MSGDCQGEMLDYRRMLMEDYSLSPEIVLHCRGEIEAHCSGLHRKGRTLHCLMRVGRGEKGANMDSMCQNAVSPTRRVKPGLDLSCTEVDRPARGWGGGVFKDLHLVLSASSPVDNGFQHFSLGELYVQLCKVSVQLCRWWHGGSVLV